MIRVVSRSLLSIAQESQRSYTDKAQNNLKRIRSMQCTPFTPLYPPVFIATIDILYYVT